MSVHDFDECLAKSHAAEDLPFWKECYEKAFHPYFESMVNHRKDGFWQRAGIDRTVILSNSKTYQIDEKVRWTDYGNDVLLEYVSNDQARSPGWVCKPLQCDYIAYAIAPRGLCLLLPTIQLQQAWIENNNTWRADPSNKHCRAKNKGYATISLAVPVDVLFKAIGSALRIEFQPFNDY